MNFEFPLTIVLMSGFSFFHPTLPADDRELGVLCVGVGDLRFKVCGHLGVNRFISLMAELLGWGDKFPSSLSCVGGSVCGWGNYYARLHLPNQ